jgi:hypothetical protein
MPIRADEQERAQTNLIRSIDAHRRFPRNVFSAEWKQFLFFDSDRIFANDFAMRILELLCVEDGNSACMMNVDIAVKNEGIDTSVLFVSRETTGEAYMSMLRGARIGEGWVYGVDRIACASDAGNWVVYCERNNEIAAIAVRDEGWLRRFRTIADSLGATSIEQAVLTQSIYGLSMRALSTEWRATMLNEYRV